MTVKFLYVYQKKSMLIISWAANQYIITISEGLCDTEDWRNDAENSALHHRNKLYLKIVLSNEVSLDELLLKHKQICNTLF